jgi:diguanylate cyclase (GGDEF)-like protein
MLVQVAERLRSATRPGDTPARLAGDEFGILLAHVDESNAHETAARLTGLICECEFTHEGQVLPLSVAIGVGMIGPDEEPETIMARADEEMYRRKAAA